MSKEKARMSQPREEKANVAKGSRIFEENVNVDSPGIETRPDITPQMLSPQLPKEEKPASQDRALHNPAKDEE